MNEISYQAVTDALQRLSLTMEGAELQGTFCGHLATQQQSGEMEWLKRLIGERDEANLQVRDDVTLIAHLLGRVQQQLHAGELQFQLLLPEEEESLQRRTEAVAAWCEGFLYGVVLAAATRSASASEVEREFLQDLMEISRVSLDEETFAEEQEAEMSFIEVVEHLRMGAMLLYEESHPPTDQPVV